MWLAKRMSLLPSCSCLLPPCKVSQPTQGVYILHPPCVLLPTALKSWKHFTTLNEYVSSRVGCFLWICLDQHFSGVFILPVLSSLQKDLLISMLAPPQPILSPSRWAYVTPCANVSFGVKAKDFAGTGKVPLWSGLRSLSKHSPAFPGLTATSAILVSSWAYNILLWPCFGWSFVWINIYILSCRRDVNTHTHINIYTHI